MPAAHPLRWRISAVTAYLMCHHLMESAGLQAFWDAFEEQFNDLEPNQGVQRSYKKKFAQRWLMCFFKTGAVFEDPEQHRGRPRKVPDEVAREMVAQLLAGYWQDVVVPCEKGNKSVVERHQRWYRSIHDAYARCEYIREQYDKYGLTDCTLLRSLQYVAPGLRRRHLHPKKALSAVTCNARVELCKRLLSMGSEHLRHYLSRVLWIDSKVFYILPRSCWVYAPASADMTATDPRLPRNRYNIKKIVYYAVVNALLGAVYIERVTGTTDRREDPTYKEYKVSHLF